MNRLTEKQKQINSSSRSSWEIFQSHRSRVTKLIVERCPPNQKTLCVLGAGNCNDIDFRQLSEVFDRIDLVDIDRDALERGVAAQDCTGDASIELYGDCDVTGVWDQLAGMHDNSDIAGLVANATRGPNLPLAHQYGVVASCGLLSQLIDGAITALGESHHALLDLVAAIRLRHLHLLAELTTGGGSAVLVTDFVSSDTAPTLPTLTPDQFPAAVMQLVEQQNFFTGLNPFRLYQALHEDEALMATIADVYSEPPWLWHFGPRSYAAFALCFRKLAGD